jgi:hypothetical protein
MELPDLQAYIMPTMVRGIEAAKCIAIPIADHQSLTRVLDLDSRGLVVLSQEIRIDLSGFAVD